MARQDDTNARRQPGSPKPQAGADDVRAQRLAAALRENLLKRKAQARGRRTEADQDASDETLSGEASAPADDSNSQAR